jgi:hypothetical protein
MDPLKPARITITGKITYSDDITLNQAAQIIAFIDSSSDGGMMMPASAARLSPEVITVGATQALTPREALDNSKAKTNPEKIVAFAASIHKEGEQDMFTLEDIKPLFRRAREATPANLSRDLDSAVRSGWVADGDNKGEYYLTKKGLDAFEEGFEKSSTSKSGSVSTPSKKPSARKPRKSSVETPEAFKDVDEIPGQMDGYVSYPSLSSNVDRFLWVIQMAKEVLKVEAVSNQDVVWLTDRLGSGIATNNINGVFLSAKKQLRVNRSVQTNKIRITPTGETYLKSLGEQ